MFKFDFALDDADIDQDLSSHLATVSVSSKTPEKYTIKEESCSQISIDKLLGCLPNVLSYSPISVPILNSDNPPLALVRRDLFDARFQLIAQENTENDPAAENALAFVEAPSDLVPGVYEGGLKTWECSVDLAGSLVGLGSQLDPRGKRILEVGCGTALPSMFLLRQLLLSPPGDAIETEIHLQDYNASVLELVSFPNILLTWYTSPAALAFRASLPPPEAEDEDAEPTPSDADPNTPGDLFLTPELKSAFLASLEAYKIRLRFFSGSWGSFPVAPYDVVLTSETIYRSESLDPLLFLLKGASVDEKEKERRCLCLVAAKVLYFGVGGGVVEFVERVKDQGGTVDTVWEVAAGVGRRIMSVQWKS
ncbi:hypothetical protein C0991_007466 [Blastosporella zonata]|nr:hypothetical protein C0991_007466 [Blastosporella zonata]